MKKKVAEFSQGAVYAYTIQNEAIHMTALNFGAVITELKTSDRSGNRRMWSLLFPISWTMSDSRGRI